MTFKPGNFVKFPGLRVNTPQVNVNIQPVQGKLILNDSNTSVKGVMTIEGDLQRMMFLSDGTIYCHPTYGVMLIRLIPFEIGEEVYCIDPIEECLTQDKTYKIIGLREEEGRIVIMDDNEKEGWYKASRFVTTKGLQNGSQTPTTQNQNGETS